MLLRGFAIQSSGNPNENRDPKNFSFWGLEFPENRGSDGTVRWQHLHSYQGYKFGGRWESKKIDIKQRLVSKVKLKIVENYGDNVMELGGFKLFS